VTGIDMAEKALAVARLHAIEAEVEVNYEATTAEAFAAKHPNHFRTVTCLEMLEHVTDYASTVQACADLAQPGADLFFSTINRNPKSYALLILAAEYVMNLLPRGTHDYSKFIKPAELCSAITQAGLEVREISGMTYNPFSHQCKINHDVDANYLVHAVKPA
jgi:2-polyprenyl-6-hydroxyphenyl methylase/3-demethylubiquinone-9 3-methyltransferase